MESKQANGGRARAEKLSPERRSEIASLGAKTRWGGARDNQVVYVVAPESGPVKIGVASRPQVRVKGLQNGHPFKLSIFGTLDPSPHPAVEVERRAHRILSFCRLSGEWFDVKPEQAMKAVREAKMELDNPDKAPRRVGLARKAVPLRLEPELIAEIDAAAKAIDTNRTYFIEDAIKARLHLAKTYVAMDKGPPKKAKALTIPAGIAAPVEPLKLRHKTAKPVKLTGGVETRSIRGYDAATGEPIYR